MVEILKGAKEVAHYFRMDGRQEHLKGVRLSRVCCGKKPCDLPAPIQNRLDLAVQRRGRGVCAQGLSVE